MDQTHTSTPPPETTCTAIKRSWVQQKSLQLITMLSFNLHCIKQLLQKFPWKKHYQINNCTAKDLLWAPCFRLTNQYTHSFLRRCWHSKIQKSFAPTDPLPPLFQRCIQLHTPPSLSSSPEEEDSKSRARSFSAPITSRSSFRIKFPVGGMEESTGPISASNRSIQTSRYHPCVWITTSYTTHQNNKLCRHRRLQEINNNNNKIGVKKKA